MPFKEQWPGHDAMIASILKNPRARRTPLDEIEAMEFILDKMKATKNNGEFFDMMRRGG